MRNIVARSGKIALFGIVTVLMAVVAFSQVSLRKAMDVDLDNKADFTVFRPSQNIWYTLKSGGGQSATNWGLAGEDFMTPGDWDGDNKGDVAVWRDTNGVFYILKSTTSTFHAVQWGITGDEPVARDYDGDGKTDYAVVRRTGGNMIWYIFRSLDSQFVGAQWGLSTDYTSPGDYDGDGKFDFSVQRPGATPGAQSTFFTLRSTAGFEAVAWGLTNDLVVPGDYDGDGKTDYAVVREGTTPTSNLTWYVLKSTNGGLLAANFGITGSDLNVQNDYDGDNKCDIAVWRDSNGSFYVFQSSTNSMVVTPWGSPNDYPVGSYDTH